jgi:hypothetical protein
MRYIRLHMRLIGADLDPLTISVYSAACTPGDDFGECFGIYSELDIRLLYIKHWLSTKA